MLVGRIGLNVRPHIPIEQLLQARQSKCFIEAVIKSGFDSRASGHIVEGNTAHHDQRHFAGGKAGSQPACDDEAVRPRHVNIEQNELGLSLFGEGERFFRVSRRFYVVSEIAQQRSNRFPNRGAIVRHEDSAARNRRRLQ